ncbi:RHS repeat domain-containing protein [Paraglaciecola sp.]|uniref:RHS repeat domain-containing protein n=1 Tax=Paraglaciecola sp. TaxID=1920173 RepID=UPI0030F45282
MNMESGSNVFLSKLFQGHKARMLALLLIASAPLQAGSVTYTYDTLGRLAKATYSSGVVIVYVYDAAGNRTSYTVSGVP